MLWDWIEFCALPGALIACMWLLVSSFNAVAGPFLAQKPRKSLRQFNSQPGSNTAQPLVSVLVPARNEERSIAATLEALCSQDYANLEILILDDSSKDATAEIVRAYAAQDARISLLQNDSAAADPPEGWTGKNWACHRLAQAASGEILLFTDADNTCAPTAVSNSVAWLEAYELGLLSAFPQQETRTLAEHLAVPMVDLFVYAGLPLWLSLYSRKPALAAANGQWMVWSRASYEFVGGHAAVNNQIVEDTELARLAKRRGIRTLVCAGRACVFGRMYHNAKEVRSGFAKNLFGLTGFNAALFIVLAAVLLLVGPVPYILALAGGSVVAWSSIAVIFLVRSLLAWRFAHPFLSGVILHPLAVLYILMIALDSFSAFRRGHVEWKERNIPIHPEART